MRKASTKTAQLRFGGLLPLVCVCECNKLSATESAPYDALSIRLLIASKIVMVVL